MNPAEFYPELPRVELKEWTPPESHKGKLHVLDAGCIVDEESMICGSRINIEGHPDGEGINLIFMRNRGNVVTEMMLSMRLDAAASVSQIIDKLLTSKEESDD